MVQNAGGEAGRATAVSGITAVVSLCPERLENAIMVFPGKYHYRLRTRFYGNRGVLLIFFWKSDIIMLILM